MKLVKLELLSPIEGHSKIRVENMKNKMIALGLWISPICIEAEHWLILDGHHRFNVAKQLGYKYVPSELFYYKDRGLTVWSLRKEYNVNKELVIRKALNRDIYPYKTAKHKFPYHVDKCMLPLSELSKYNMFDHDKIDYNSKDKI